MEQGSHPLAVVEPRSTFNSNLVADYLCLSAPHHIHSSVLDLAIMAPIDSHEVEVPESYSSLPVEHIKVSNHPENAAGVTPVQIITLNRPKQRNAFTARMTEDLILAYNTFDVDERVKCVVLTGAGDSFCAGADLQMGFSALGRAERMQDNRDTYEHHVH